MTDNVSADNIQATRRVRGNQLSARESMQLGNAFTNVGDSDHTTALDEFILGVDSSSANTVTLSDAAADRGLAYIIMDTGSNANNNNITLTAESDGSHNVNGSNQDLTIDLADGMAIVVADSSGDWWLGTS